MEIGSISTLCCGNSWSRLLLWWGCRGRCAGPSRKEAHLPEAEEEEGVKVAGLLDQTPVQARCRAVAGCLLDEADDVTEFHGLPAPDRRVNGQICGA
jgi:hypothetical protein